MLFDVKNTQPLMYQYDYCQTGLILILNCVTVSNAISISFDRFILSCPKYVDLMKKKQKFDVWL